MKTLPLLTLSIFISVAFYGCSKSSSSSNTNNNNNNNNNNTNVTRDTLLGSLSAYVDDTLVQFDAYASATWDSLSNGYTLSITGEELTAPYSDLIFTLSLAGPVNGGTYGISTTPTGYLYFIYTTPQYTGTDGSYSSSNNSAASITINPILTRADTVAIGTFTGGILTGPSTIPANHTITGGKFNVKVTF